MDLISTRAIEVANLALDGLAARHRVLSANVANAQTPGYQRSDVVFEDQLKSIINIEDAKESVKLANSAGMGINFNSNSLDSVNAVIPTGSDSANMILASDSYKSFKPVTLADNSPAVTSDGNNINIEQEMTELMKNGTKYNVLSDVEAKMFKKMQEVIKGVV